MQDRSDRSAFVHQRSAYTLVEILVTVAIIAVLIALLLPALASTLGLARGFKCSISQRSTAFDFSVFSDDQLFGDRGNDESMGDDRYRLETFQESQYSIDEFWSWDDRNSVTLPDADGNNPMRCSAVKGDIVLRRNLPCSRGGVGPSENISFGFNVRLHRAEIANADGTTRLVPIVLNANSFARPEATPLFWDVDGEQAARENTLPVFSGPSLDSQAWGDDALWFPGFRHGRRANFAFVDGHVETSASPLDPSNGWLWNFQPIR